MFAWKKNETYDILIIKSINKKIATAIYWKINGILCRFGLHSVSIWTSRKETKHSWNACAISVGVFSFSKPLFGWKTLSIYLFIYLPRILPAHIIIHYADVVCLFFFVGLFSSLVRTPNKNKKNRSQFEKQERFDCYGAFLFSCDCDKYVCLQSRTTFSDSCWTRWWPKRRRCAYRVNKQLCTLPYCMLCCCFFYPQLFSSISTVMY